MDYSKYPDDWWKISYEIRANRAGWKCEKCGAEAHKAHPITGSIVVLTVAHLGIAKPDGTPGDKYDTMDCRPENLMAMCQRCHLAFDQKDHIRKSAETRIHKRHQRHVDAGQLTLFDLGKDLNYD